MPRSVLVVEDDGLTAAALVRALTRRGHRTVAVGTVQAGLAQLDGHAFLILDLNLPDALGTALLEHIRAEGHPVRVAIVTGTTDPSLLSAACRYEPDLLLRKPYDLAVLTDWLEGAPHDSRS